MFSKENTLYYLIRAFLFPFSLMSLPVIHAIGKPLGTLCYHLLRKYRKRTLSNLALATHLHLSEKILVKVAKKSFQNLVIVCLEYARLAKEKNLDKIIICKNPEIANAISQQGKGIVFFCAHQANWEVLFLDGTNRMKGMALGKAIKNKKLYQWIVSIRERCGGTIIDPKYAIFGGQRALKKGVFLGIVADQAMPTSPFSYPFLGRRAWTSTAPALLAYRTNSPIIFAKTIRKEGKYFIEYSDPLYPDLNTPIEDEVKRLMNHFLHLLEESIKQYPDQWLWQHNRWKQLTPKRIYKRFRHDCVCIILPEKQSEFVKLKPALALLKEIYLGSFITLVIPEMYKEEITIDSDEKIYYKNIKDILLPDYRFKMIFNFTTYSKVKSHFKKLSAFEILTIKDLQKIAQSKEKLDYVELIKKSLCRPGTI